MGTNGNSESRVSGFINFMRRLLGIPDPDCEHDIDDPGNPMGDPTFPPSPAQCLKCGGVW